MALNVLATIIAIITILVMEREFLRQVLIEVVALVLSHVRQLVLVWGGNVNGRLSEQGSLGDISSMLMKVVAGWSTSLSLLAFE